VSVLRSGPQSAPALDAVAAELTATWSRPRGLIGWVTSTDHKEIGLRFIVTAFGFFALGGVLAFFMRLQLARPANHVLGPDLYDQFFTTHGTSMMFLFAVPVMEGMGLYFVPLMIGTRNVAFPRLINFSWWTYLFAGLLLYVALALNAGPDAGWFAYTPLSGAAFSPGKRVDVWCQMITIVEMSTIGAAIAILVTILRQRAPGMSLDRIPLFVWAQLVTAFMIVFAMPAVQLATTLLGMDRLSTLDTHFFDVPQGGDAMLWQHLFWYFGHPEVYIVFLPAAGFVSEILPAFTRRPNFAYPISAAALVATGFIAFGVWAHHMFATPLPEISRTIFSGTSLLVVVPGAAQIFAWVGSLFGGRIRLATPMLWVLGFLFTFVIGGMTGVMLASASLDTQLHDTFFVVAHLHYVLIGGGVFPLFGALHFWFPKWTGRRLDERLGRWQFATFFVGFHTAFFPMHVLGLEGMPRRVYTYLPETGWGPLNLLATAGATLLAISVVLFAVNVLRSLRHVEPAGDDPWAAPGLEWSIPSPPPVYGFRNLPVVHGRSARWDAPDDPAVVTGLSTTEREVLVTTVNDAVPHHRFHVSDESPWPFVLALVVAATFTGLIFDARAAVIGVVLGVLVLTAWFWPTHEPEPIVHPALVPDRPRSPEEELA